MSKLTRAWQWFHDVTQVIFLDRFNPRRRHLAESASTACRSLNFHSRSKIRPLPLAEIITRLGGAEVTTVLLAGPSTDFGDVGSQAGYHTLGSLMQSLRPRRVLEFGTYLGVSTHALALNAPPDGHIHTVDLPDQTEAGDRQELDALDQRHVATSRHRVSEAFLNAPTSGRITQIRADSLAFRAKTVVQNVDLVYVDGGHSQPVIQADTENAFRVLAADGTIVWEDYFHLYPDVVKFLDDLAEQHELHSIQGTNYVIFSRRWRKTSSPTRP